MTSNPATHSITIPASHHSAGAVGVEYTPGSIASALASARVRVDRETHEELKRLARELGTTVGEAVAIAARRLRQQRIGKELSTPLTRDEVDWLDADLS